MRLWILAIFLLNPVLCWSAQNSNPPTDPSANLDITIQGKSRDRLELQQAAPDMPLELHGVLDPATDKTEELLGYSPGISKAPDFAKTTLLESDQAARPWLPEITQPPVVSFQPKVKQTKNLKWQLTITDEGGSQIKILKGKGIPKEGIQWEGTDDNGAMVRVDTIYGYRFSLMSDDGRLLQSTPGESFRLETLQYWGKDFHRIEFSNKALFNPGSAEFRQEFQWALEKAFDILRENSRYAFAVEQSPSDNSVLLAERGKALANALAHALIIQEGDIQITVSGKKDRGDITAILIYKK